VLLYLDEKWGMFNLVDNSGVRWANWWDHCFPHDVGFPVHVWFSFFFSFYLFLDRRYLWIQIKKIQGKCKCTITNMPSHRTHDPPKILQLIYECPKNTMMVALIWALPFFYNSSFCFTKRQYYPYTTFFWKFDNN